MSFFVMTIVIFAAILHASWNFLVKSFDDKHLSMTSVVLGHVPFALMAIAYFPIPDIKSFPYIIAGAFLHSGYQIFLLASYKAGDLSQVYPLARGVSPLIVAFISVVFLGVKLSSYEIYGVIVIGTGIISLTLVRKKDGLRNFHAAVLALLTGCFIASYSLVDGMGARLANTATGFYGWLSIGNALIFSFFIFVKKPGTIRKAVLKDYRFTLAGGAASFLAYALVTWSFTVAPIPLVTALRETSIIFALFLGVFVLKEKFDIIKMFATLFTLLGVGLLKINR